MLVEQGLVDLSMIDDLMGEYIVDYGEQLIPLIVEFWKTNPWQGDKVEYLYNLIKQRHALGHGWGLASRLPTC